MKQLLLICIAGSLALIGRAETAAYLPPTPAQEVAVTKLNWHDAKRNRDVPVKIYFPKDGSEPFPVLIFSHGLGGSRDGYEYLGRHWAGCGYVSVHVQHPGSDDSVWKDVPAKRHDGLSGRYILQLRSDLNRMATAFPGPVASGELDQWLRGMDGRPCAAMNCSRCR